MAMTEPRQTQIHAGAGTDPRPWYERMGEGAETAVCPRCDGMGRVAADRTVPFTSFPEPLEDGRSIKLSYILPFGGDEPGEAEADFPPRTIAEMADEQRAFLATVNPTDYIDDEQSDTMTWASPLSTNDDTYHDVMTRLGVDLGGWVAVSERLPGERETVLIYDRSSGSDAPRITMACLSFGEWHDLTNDEGIADEPANVTHWQSLPSAPPEPLAD